MTTNQDEDLSRGFTRTAFALITASARIAVAHRKNNRRTPEATVVIQPLHLFLAALGGPTFDIDRLDQLKSVEEPGPLLWRVINDLSLDQNDTGNKAVSLAKAAKESLEKSLQAIPDRSEPPPPPSNQEHKRKRDYIRELGRTKRANQEPTSTQSGSSPRELTPLASPLYLAVIGRAKEHKATSGDELVAPYHLIWALSDDKAVQGVLQAQSIEHIEFVRALKARKGDAKITSPDDDLYPFLSKYALNMSDSAAQGKLGEIIGRDEEIRRIIQILCRKTKNSAVLLGEPGVGKTAVAEGLAHRIYSQQVPEHLRGTIYSLDLGSLFAGAGKGDYEARVKGIIDDVMRSQQTANPAILFIDELHLITFGKSGGGQNSGMDAANLLKPALARGQFRCIGATTLSEYREHIEKDGALERRFATVRIDEPTVEETITILRGIRDRYEKHHQVWITDQALVTASNLAHRYLTSRRLPDSAVDLLDEACASARVSQDMKPEVIDTVEQEILRISTYIEALQRDTSHPDDAEALRVAQHEKVDLEQKKKELEEQQEAVTKWWDEIALLRKKIQETKAAIAAGGRSHMSNWMRGVPNEKQLRTMQDELVKLEQTPPVSSSPHARNSVNSFPILSPHVINQASVAAVVERATKIPVQRLLATDKSRLLKLESSLAEQVIGQPEAVKAVARAIQLSRTGLSSANKPIASFLFTGPSGTGKTLLSKALAQELFGQATSMVRIDGSEYSQSHSVSRLIGSPPGYVGYDQGGQLTEYVRRTPYCIVLLDEIEKTCTEFLTVFLQVLDEGRLTDGQGRLIDFRNCVIIMTSNVGASILSKVDTTTISESTQQEVIRCFKADARFPVEFLNRIDDIIMFHKMSPTMMGMVLEKHLKDVREREGLKKLRLNIDSTAKDWLIQAGMSPDYGARLLARTIQKELLNPLSERLLEESIRDGDTVDVRVSDRRDGLFVAPNHAIVP